MKKIRLGITMRRMSYKYSNGNIEERDAIAVDWYRFISYALPKAIIIPIPNNENSVSIVQTLSLDGLILSGGDDFGISLQRDCSEKNLLSYAQKEQLPVLGVCRGAQLIHLFCNGKPLCPVEGHSGTRHLLQFSDGKKEEVSSYHHKGIRVLDLPPELTLKASTLDGIWAEAFYHNFLPWYAIMWHPERENAPKLLDKDIVFRLFGEKKNG